MRMIKICNCHKVCDSEPYIHDYLPHTPEPHVHVEDVLAALQEAARVTL